MPLSSLIPRLRAAFLAAARPDAQRVDLNIAGQAVRITYADEALQKAFTPSLQGLIAQSASSTGSKAHGLSIHAWAGRADGMPCPDIVADLERFPDKISVVNAGNLHLQYNPEGQILSCIDTDLGEAYYHVTDVSRLPDYEICTPMRMLFNWSCAMHGVLMVHAAAVGKDGVGALIVGKSGAGKSTTALQCLLNGLDYLGDDYVAVAAGSEDCVVHQLYRGCKVMDDALERLPVLAPHVIMHNRPNRKSVVILDDTLGALVPSFRLAAIVRSRVAGLARSSFSPLSPRQVITEFAGSTILQMPGTGSYMLRELSRLCSRIPAFEMSLGTAPDEISGALHDFLRQYSGQ